MLKRSELDRKQRTSKLTFTSRTAASGSDGEPGAAPLPPESCRAMLPSLECRMGHKGGVKRGVKRWCEEVV